MSLGVISGHLSTFRALDKMGGGWGGVRKVRETLERAGRKDKPTTLFIIHLQAGENAGKLHNL